MDPAYFLIGHRHYSIRQLKKFLNSAGFELVKQYTTGGFFFLSKSLIESVWKRVAGTKPNFSKWFSEIVESEYKNGGFATIHLVAKKK